MYGVVGSWASFIELLRNYWGYELFDPDAPLYKLAYQFMRHIFNDQLNPITVGSAPTG